MADVEEMTNDDIDALLADAASLADEANVEVDAGESAVVGETSDTGESADAPAAAEVEQEASASIGEKVDAALNDVDKQLAELEAVLEEVDETGETAAAEGEAGEAPAETADVESVAVASDDASDATTDPPADEGGDTVDDGSAVNTDPAADQPSAPKDGPMSAPQEWLKEAGFEDMPDLDMSDDFDDSAPLPDKPVKPVPDKPKVAAEASPAFSSDSVLGAVVGSPFVVLAFLDKPFSGVSKRTKSIIGYAAIATFVNAVAIWVVGSFLVDS